MKCPKCESENCQYVSTTKTSRSGFDFGDACCGSVLLGPIGILCGLCGMSTETETKEYWVCHNCGQKFQGNGEKIEEGSPTLIKHYETVFIKDVVVEDSLNKNSFWQTIQVGHDKYVKNSNLSAKYIDSSSKQNYFECETVLNKCVKYKGEDVRVYFAIAGVNGLLVLEDGIFLVDHMIKGDKLKSIIYYGKKVYFNQYVFLMNTVEEAHALYQLMTYLYPEAESKKIDRQEEVFAEIQQQDGSHMYSTHYTKQNEYEWYIRSLKDEYLRCYQELYPYYTYSEYMKLKEERKKKNKIMLIIQIILAIVLILVLGIVGPIVSIILFFIINKIEEKKWNKKREAYGMSKELQILEQLEDEDNYHFGKINFTECKDSIKEMKEKISIQDEYRG